MIDIVSFLVFLKGIEYTYTFVRISVKYYHIYSEIYQKIQYIHTGYNFIKEENIQKKSYSAFKYMGKLAKSLFKVGDALYFASLEREEARFQKRKERLFTERKRREKEKDTLKEREMYLMGFLRDKLSRHYIKPDTLLQYIYEAVQEKLHSDIRFNQEQKNKCLELVFKAECEEEFKPFKSVFYYLDVKDRITGMPFESVLLDDKVYTASSILYLQKSKEKMVYHNLPVLMHENEFSG